MKNSNYVKMACVSDIHLKHQRNPTSNIIKNLKNAFKDDAEFAELDILFIAGDIFHRLVMLPDKDVFFIDNWFCNLLFLCQKHDVMLRVLEGTDSHDRTQPARISAVLEMTGYNVDYKYINTISIEYNERLNKNIAYIPDNYGLGSEDNLAELQELMKAKGIVKFDIGCFHGTFDYQLPPAAKADSHNSATYLAMCNDVIVIGHHHTHSRKSKIIAQGSFDRLAHGEEEPKGHVVIKIYPQGRIDVTFVENVDAMRFVTLDCSLMEAEQAWAYIQTKIKVLPLGSNVRIRVDRDSALNTALSVLFNTYPEMVWLKEVADKEQHLVIDTQLGDDDAIFTPVEITKQNIKQLLMERFSHQAAIMGIDQSLLVTACEKIDEVV